jgi:microsomal dipeptidase-like Zn-dependent dipeptidase
MLWKKISDLIKVLQKSFMKIVSIVFLLIAAVSVVNAQDIKQKMLEALKQTGYVRQQGNHIIFKVQKASDTPQIKMMYGALFASDKFTIGFDVDGKYFEKSKAPWDDKISPIVKNNPGNCIKDINIITAERLMERKVVKFSGDKMYFKYNTAADTGMFRQLYPSSCKIRYHDIIYDVVFYKDGVGSSSDSLVIVADRTIPVPVTTLREYHFLKNPDFEMPSTFIPHWRKIGKAFEDALEGQNQLTWKDMKVVSVGGNYWKDLNFFRGQHNRYWITSLPNDYGGTWEQRGNNGGGATGALFSDPFKIYHFQKFLSFLIAGGRDENNLKVELLQLTFRPRISGDITSGDILLPGVERRSVRTSTDTLYEAVPGIAVKTGHNSELFRREWWNVSNVDTSKWYVIRIFDNATARGWNYINVDDFRFLSKNPLTFTGEDSLRIHRVSVIDFVSNERQDVYVDYYTPLFGSADTHTHLMSHLSMGGKLMHGAPDVGSIMPAGTIYKDYGDPFAKDCNTNDRRAGSVEEALGNCNATHGGWGTDNTCGNYLRAMLINLAFDDGFEHKVPFERNPHGDHPHAGFPRFEHWPHFSSMSHQQMYVDWIKRAYEGGLRVLVTLAVNNELLGNMVDGNQPMDDKTAYDLQVEEIKQFVYRHNDFMELALSSADMRRIVQSGKMAVILGIEVDNLGSFNYAGNLATESKVRTEVRRLYDNGVRYIFPIHLTDNAFGGMAVYSALFAFSNKFARTRPIPIGQPLPPGFMLEVESARDPRINYKLTLLHERLPPGTTAGLTVVAKPILDFIGEVHFPFLINFENCIEGKIKCIPQFKIITSLLSEPGWDFYNAVSGGHVNRHGLSSLGKFAVREMMKLGMIVDIDHMSEKAVNDALTIAEEFQYPLISGHNGLRDGVSEHADHKVNENHRSRAQLERLSRLNGVFGLGIGENTSATYLSNFRRALPLMGNKAITMGSDINGFVVMPGPRSGSHIIYNNETRDNDMTMCTFGPANKTWDYNRDGVAHIGLYPDFFQDLKDQGMTQRERQVFFNAADYLVNMWQQCERQSNNVR